MSDIARTFRLPNEVLLLVEHLTQHHAWQTNKRQIALFRGITRGTKDRDRHDHHLAREQFAPLTKAELRHNGARPRTRSLGSRKRTA